MTDEEYLRACGWVDRWTQRLVRDEDRWTHEKREGFTFTLAQAVEAQLAEDRARLAFVLARAPQPEPLPPHILLRALEALLGAVPTGNLTAEDERIAARHVVTLRGQTITPWRRDGDRWLRDAAAIAPQYAAEVAEARRVIGSEREPTWLVYVCRPDGRALPTIEARNGAEGREVADLLLAAVGWPPR